VLTTIRVEDEEGAKDKLNENIASIERAAERPLKTVAAHSSLVV
jgi:translation elongation factor EF-1beta